MRAKHILRNCSDVGVLMAHPLLRHMNITGASITAAKFKPAWKSPCQTPKCVRICQNLKKICGGTIFVALCYLNIKEFYLTRATIPCESNNTCFLIIHLKGISSTCSLRQLRSDMKSTTNISQQMFFFNPQLVEGAKNLRNRWWNGEEIMLLRAIMYWHLPAFSMTIFGSKALVGKFF